MALKIEKDLSDSDERTVSRQPFHPTNRKRPGKVRVVPRLKGTRVEEQRSAPEETGRQSSKKEKKK